MEPSTERNDIGGIEEKGIALLARAILHPPVPDLCPELFKISAGDSVQVSGTTGCSMLLYHLLSRTLLPAQWCGVDLGGCGSEALFIDTDQRFSVLQLAAIMEASLKKKIWIAKKQSCSQFSKNIVRLINQKQPSNLHTQNSPYGTNDATNKNDIINNCAAVKKVIDSKNSIFKDLSKEECEHKIKTLVSECLKKLVYLKCQFSGQFLTTILSIDQILAARPLIVLVFIDSFPSYYWSDRIYSSESWEGINKHYNTYMRSLLTHLRKNGVALIYVKTESLSQNNTTFQRVSNDKFMTHSYSHCGEASTKSSFPYEHCSSPITVTISTKELNNNLSDSRRRRHIYEVQVHTDEGVSFLQATIHQYGIKWHV